MLKVSCRRKIVLIYAQLAYQKEKSRTNFGIVADHFPILVRRKVKYNAVGECDSCLFVSWIDGLMIDD